MKSIAINRGFAKLWTASSLSNIGDGIARSAFPLLAAMLTRDPTLVAGFTFALSLPWLLFSLQAGALIDRWDRKRVLVWAAALRMLLLAGLSLIIFSDLIQLSWLYLVAFLYGIIEVFFDNASTTILPSVVERQELEAANSRLYAARFLGNGLLGPSVGSFLFAVFAGLPFLVHGGLLVFTTALVAALRGTFRGLEEVPAERGIREDIGEAFSWLRKNRLLFNLAATAAVLNVSGRAGRAVLVLYALEILNIGEQGYGVLLSVATVGGVLGTLLATPVSDRLGAGRTILVSVFLIAFSQPLMVLGDMAWLTAAALGTRSFAIVLWNVNVVSLRQTIVPDELLGRVNSVYRLVGMGATPVGALLGGLIADRFGLRSPFLVGGAAVMIVFFIILPVINNRTLAAAKQKPPD